MRTTTVAYYTTATIVYVQIDNNEIDSFTFFIYSR